jgi:hypothetical protein
MDSYFSSNKKMQKYLDVLRPKKWLLNLLVIVPLFLSQNLLDKTELGKTLLGVAIFCVTASATYVLNDLFDRDRDRAHPEKKSRPVAAGSIKTPVAIAIATVLSVVGIIGSFMLNAEFGLIILAYFVIALWLSAWLQSIPLIDVCVRMILAVLRVLAGAALIQAVVPVFVVMTTAFGVAAIFFGRQLHTALSTSTAVRGFSISFLRGVVPVAITTFIGSYMLFSLSAFTQDGTLGLKNNTLLYGDIFIFFLALAFTQNVYSTNKKSPLSDPRILIASLAYLILTYLFLYVFRV